MPRDFAIVAERIRQGQCPICGKSIEGESILVLDNTFGEIWICSKHMVQGAKRLREDDVPCGQDTKDNEAPAVITEKLTE